MSMPTHELLKQFADNMANLYGLAELLRDRVGQEDKKIFNDTRRALYNLQDEARELYYKWKPKE